MTDVYFCCEHCILDSDGACGEGVDHHWLPCPEGCFIGGTVVDEPRTDDYPHHVRGDDD